MVRSVEDYKRWYYSAVKSELILNWVMQEEEAEEAISKYHLRERLDKYPDVQMHYDPESVALEMFREGFIEKPVVFA